MLEREQRRNPRFEVQLQCEVRSPLRAFDSLAGVTLNMSRVGLLFCPEEACQDLTLPQTGHAARVILQLPAPAIEQARTVECLGRVVRLEQQGGSTRIALEFRRYHFSQRGRG